PEFDYIDVLARIRALVPAPPVFILTAFASIDTAIEAIRQGAYDYLSKPFRVDEIKLAVRRVLETERLVRENREFRQELQGRYGVERLIGQSPEMVAIYRLGARVAAPDTTLLIQGETGTGKALLAGSSH